MATSKPNTIDEYISQFPEETQTILNLIRDLIKHEVPDASEKISYGLPTFTLNKTYLVYFAGYANHIGLYPTPSGIEEFKAEFENYKTGKGSIQFPLSEPIPYDLIAKIVRYRKGEVESRKMKR